MSVSAVICEFNPFHNGHKYLLERMKAENDSVLCIMSGNFVQRGEIALCDKFLRAEAAVKNGADLVIELPLPYALGSAETFARGGVGVLNKLGVVDRLYFGSESELNTLLDICEKTKTEEFSVKLKECMKRGLSYPDAFFAAAGDVFPCGSNDILAIEYIRQLNTLGSSIIPCAVIRTGSAHDSDVPCGEYASASYIRKLLRSGNDASEYTFFQPERTEIADFSKIETTVMSVLRSMRENDLALIADVNEGLEHRLRKAVSEAENYEDFFEKVRTKRYTLSRIRRIILCAYLGVTKEMQKNLPGYINVLACNENGMKLLSDIKKQGSITPIIRFSDTLPLSEKDKDSYGFTMKCDDLYGLAFEKLRPVGYDLRHRFSIIR